MNKKVLRDLFLEKRLTLTRDEHQHRSELVCKRVLQFISESDFSSVHLFLPIEKFKEVNTWPIYKFLIDSSTTYPVTSICDFGTKSLTHFKCENSTQFKRNKYGIPEPQNGLATTAVNIDLILTPLISFDRAGNRIGYGGGFYDIFLNECSPRAKKVGLAITPPLDNIDYVEEHDHQLDFCLTHHGLYNFLN